MTDDRCLRRLWDDAPGLRCVLAAGHASGHRYESSSVSDGHTASEDAAEAKR